MPECNLHSGFVTVTRSRHYDPAKWSTNAATTTMTSRNHWEAVVRASLAALCRNRAMVVLQVRLVHGDAERANTFKRKIAVQAIVNIALTGSVTIPPFIDQPP